MSFATVEQLQQYAQEQQVKQVDVAQRMDSMLHSINEIRQGLAEADTK